MQQNLWILTHDKGNKPLPLLHATQDAASKASK
jgi:hypothetical protein